MLARYKIYRGKRPVNEPLPGEIRQDTRGHSNIQTTCVDTHISIEDLRAAPSPLELLEDPEAKDETGIQAEAYVWADPTD